MIKVNSLSRFPFRHSSAVSTSVSHAPLWLLLLLLLCILYTYMHTFLSFGVGNADRELKVVSAAETTDSRDSLE